jgi:hypothetical protein
MKDRLQRYLSFFLRHPLLVFIVGAILLSVAAIFVFSPGSSGDDTDPAPTAQQEEEERPRAYGGNIFKDKEGQEIIRKNRNRASPSYDRDPERQEEERKKIESRPALQKLPHYDAGIAIDVLNITPDGKPVVEVVRPMGTSKDIAEDIWELFIESTHDSKKNYVVVHREI